MLLQPHSLQGGASARPLPSNPNPCAPCRCAWHRGPAWQPSPAAPSNGTAQMPRRLGAPIHQPVPLAPCHAASEAASPWSEDDLAQLSQQVELEGEASLGEEWRSLFIDNPADLFYYAQDEALQWAMLQHRIDKVSKVEAEASGLLQAASVFSPPLVNELIGMGTWRLKGEVDPAIAFLVQRLEGTWREIFSEDLSLYPREKWKGKYDMCDSMDPARELKGWSYGDIPNPERGQEGYPRLLLENRVYSSRVFRKLHLEVGARQDGLQVLHVVLYPRYTYDMPILAMDMVVVNDEVTLAIVDACPVRENQALPEYYLKTMLELQQQFLTDADNGRRIPEWGSNIFSSACVCIRPESPEDLAGFVAYAAALHRAHCMLATLMQPLNPSADPLQKARQEQVMQGHKRFVENQLSNKKTSRVLEVAFGVEWTQAYMTELMFDYAPDDEAPLEDMSVVQLYKYFEQVPELGSGGRDVARLEAEVAVSRAEQVLDSLARGEPVRQDKCEAALEVLFRCDSAFQANCLEMMPELAYQGPTEIGALLTRRLQELGLGNPVPRWTTKLQEEEREEPQGEWVDDMGAMAAPGAMPSAPGSA